jgi:hypothetical protein
MEQIPEFETLDEEVAFWESHDSADYWEDMEEMEFEVDLHRNLLHPKLVVLAYRPERCPRCQHELKDIMIEYIVSDNGSFRVVRDVPALLCQINRHEYILESTLDEVMYLLELEERKRIKPTATLSVPVFSLQTAV